MDKILRHDQHCRLCGSNHLATALKLEDTPLEDQFLKTAAFQSTFPLELALCEDCGYLHLPYIVSPEVSYSDYMYVSGVTVGLRQHYDTYAEDNPLKHETFSPGHHIPVYSSTKLYEEDSAYVLVLAWQHQKSILEKHSILLDKGFKFIIPLPDLKVI